MLYQTNYRSLFIPVSISFDSRCFWRHPKAQSYFVGQIEKRKFLCILNKISTSQHPPFVFLPCLLCNQNISFVAARLSYLFYSFFLISSFFFFFFFIYISTFQSDFCLVWRSGTRVLKFFFLANGVVTQNQKAHQGAHSSLGQNVFQKQ